MNINVLLEMIKPNFIKGHALKNELVVSLTSYPKRFNILPYTIKSLLNQSVKPDRIILWLYKEDFSLLPASVKELERLGLQILLIEEDWKSYNKILPTLLHYPNSYIITCDDDVLYKPTLIEELIECHQRVGGAIAQRAHIIQFSSDGSLLPYSKWLENTPTNKFYEINSPLVFPTGVGGVLYPPNCFDENVTDINKAIELCPTADDIWLYFMANRNSTNFSLIGGRGLIDLNQDHNESLWAINSQGENDRQFKNLINEFGMPEPLQTEIINTCQNIKNPHTVKLKNGKCIETLDDHIGHIITNTGIYYEYDLIAFIKRFFSPKNVVDVGANIGNHALGFSGHPKYKVICFEPDPELAKIARNNLKMNSIDHEIHIYGLGQKEEKLPFIPGNNQNSGCGKFDRESTSSRMLNIKRLDDCICKEFEVNLIKIDVEGFELDVLLGALDTINQSHPVLVIEHLDYNHYTQCKELISKLGYMPLKVFCATPTFVYLNAKAYDFPKFDNQVTWVDCWNEFTQKHIA